MVGVPSLVRSVLGIVMLTDLRGRDVTPVFAQVVGAPHANETALIEVVFLFRTQRNGVDDRRQVVSIAAYHLDKLILLFIQGTVVDPPSIHFAKPELASLSDESTTIGGVTLIVFFLVVVTYRCTVDDHIGSFDGFFGLVAGFHPQFSKVTPPVFIHAEPGAFLTEGGNF